MSITDRIPGRRLFVGIALALLVPAAAAQAGVLVANAYSGDKKPRLLTVLSVEAATVVDNQVARTTLTQVFVNETGTKVEGLYIARLPEDAGVISFAHWIGERRVEGVLEEKGAARQIYADAQRRELAPALLEYAGGNKFQMKLDDIGPGERKKIELVYDEILPYAGGAITYRLPLSAPVTVRQTIKSLVWTMKLADAKPIVSSQSPWPEVKLSQPDKHHLEGRCQRQDLLLDDDLAVIYKVESSELGATLLFHRPDPDKDGFFMLMVAPQEVTGASDIVRKDVLFVFDVSGSMEGEKIEQARSALKLCLANMNDGDGLNILGFSSDIAEFRNKVLALDGELRAKANRFVESLEAGGGTNIDLALDRALTYLKDKGTPGRPKLIIFMTDGMGDRPPEQTLARVRQDNVIGARIFTFGVGSDVNTAFLEELARQNRGDFVHIAQTDQLENVVARFYAGISKPVLTEMELDFGDVTVRRLYPQIIPDVYKGRQVIIVGRYEGDGQQKVTVTGKLNNAKRSFPLTLGFPAREDDHAFVARIWAMRRVDDLLRLIRKEGERKEYVEEIVALSKKYRFATPYTSFVAVDKPPVLAQKDPAGPSGTPPPAKDGPKPAPSVQPAPPPSPEPKDRLAYGGLANEERELTGAEDVGTGTGSGSGGAGRGSASQTRAPDGKAATSTPAAPVSEVQAASPHRDADDEARRARAEKKKEQPRPPPPVIEVIELDVSGPLQAQRDSIQARLAGQLVTCREAARVAAGAVPLFELTVGPDGQVRAAAVREASGLPGASVQCLLAALRKLRLPGASAESRLLLRLIFRQP